MTKFRIEDVFEIRSIQNIVITGRVEEGSIKVGDFIILPDNNYLRVDKIETFRTTFNNQSRSGYNIGIILGRGNCDPSKEYLTSFLKESLQIMDLSELREIKLKKLDI